MLWSTQYCWILSTSHKKLSELPYKYLIPPWAIRIDNKTSQLLFQTISLRFHGFYCFYLKSTNDIGYKQKFWAGFCISLLLWVGCMDCIQLYVTSLVSHCRLVFRDKYTPKSLTEYMHILSSVSVLIFFLKYKFLKSWYYTKISAFLALLEEVLFPRKQIINRL